MSLTDASLRHPWTLLALVLLLVILGGLSYFQTPRDLFPETAPPQAVVIATQPGASAQDMASNVTEVLEKELATLSGVDTITSTSRDGVSSIQVAFRYVRDRGGALTDVSNALDRVRGELPANMPVPRVYPVTEATSPVLTLALNPKAGSPKDLAAVRLLAENPIKDRLLGLPAVGDVEVFGGHRPQVRVRVDRDRLAAHGLALSQLVATLKSRNLTVPAGRIYTGDGEYQVSVDGQFTGLAAIRELVLERGPRGSVTVGDVAEVALGEAEPRSLYHGNGQPAIAVNIMRPESGATLAAIEAVKAELPDLRAAYPDLNWAIADDSEPLIRVNARGMNQSLVQAVILTVAVIFLFLANWRAAAVASVSIPLAFLGSFMVLGLTPNTLNMITMSGLIIAVGLVIDSSVVVLENIYRHFRDRSQAGETGEEAASNAARSGSGEVARAVTAGMLTTVVVLVPVMFTGGYVERIMRPLNLMIIVTLIGALLSALTVIPVIAARLLARSGEGGNRFERWVGRGQALVDGVGRSFLAMLRGGLRWRWLTLGLAAGFLVVTFRLVPPLIGNELLPPMDTGIVTVEFETPAHFRPSRVERVLGRVEARIRATPGVERMSSVVGSEPGQISFGGGGATAQTARLTVHLVDRTQRETDIWTIEDRWRADLRRIAGVRSLTISEYGATPVSTTKAPLDIIISGSDTAELDRLADRVLAELQGLPGLVDVQRSWFPGKPERVVRVDPELARLYGTDSEAVGRALQAAIAGVPAGDLRLEGFLDIPLEVAYTERQLDGPEALAGIHIPTDFGPVPLRAMATVERDRQAPYITREDLRATIDITGVNRTYTIGQVAAMAEQRLQRLELPAGYSVAVAGTITDLAENKRRMASALVPGLGMLYLLLMALFRSFRHPLTIMAAIPLSAAGALWGLLWFDKPLCMPAIMGIILLAGTVVNNAILLLDFVEKARERGVARDQAVQQAVRLRLRPVLMTTVSTVVGLSPLVLELAVGLERMSPLGVAAAVGLTIGTVWTLVVIPVVYTLLDDLSEAVRGLWARRPATEQGGQ